MPFVLPHAAISFLRTWAFRFVIVALLGLLFLGVWLAPYQRSTALISAAAQASTCGANLTALLVSRQIPVGREPRALASGDLNQDGRPDLVVADINASNQYSATILLGNGVGDFEPVTTLPTVSLAQNVELADFNRDGKLDIALPSSSTGVNIWLGQGDGTFPTVKRFITDEGASVTSAADFDGDNLLDLAIVSYSSSKLSILRGLGDGSFRLAEVYATGVSAKGLVTADLNRDGRPDILIPFWQEGLWVHLNQGNGQFRAGRKLENTSEISAVAVQDFNGDGSADLALGMFSVVSLYFGDGTGLYQNLPTVRLRMAGEALALADFNQDGKIDVAAADARQGRGGVGVALNRGNEQFDSPIRMASGISPVSLVAADFNRDSQLDLAAANLKSDTVGVLLSAGRGDFLTARVADLGSGPLALAAADLNRDAKLDLLATSGATAPSTALGNADGTFGEEKSYNSGFAFNCPCPSGEVSDFDNDGFLDWAVLSGAGDTFREGVIVVLYNDGSGVFKPNSGTSQNRVREFKVGVDAVDMVMADFNRDGRQDFLVAQRATNELSLLLGQANGQFAAPQRLPLSLSPRALALGDFNRDGRMDVVVAHRESTTLSILLGSGTGTFTVRSVVISIIPRALKVGDFNQDGQSDLLALGEVQKTVVVALGDGTGFFSLQPGIDVGALPLAAALGDLTGDGKLDIALTRRITGESFDNKVFLYAGNGAGQFALNAVLPVTAAGVLLAQDLNNDGLTDLAVGMQDLGSGSGLWVLLNRCQPAMPQALANVSAASYRGLYLAPESVISVFGAQLSLNTQAAFSQPLPTELAGTRVAIRDSAGRTSEAPLFYVSPNQINYLLPPATASGPATIRVSRADGMVATGTLDVAPVAPGLFTANANGQGVPAAVLLRIKPDGRQVYEPVAQFDASLNRFEPLVLDPGYLPQNFNDQTFLILFGTGLRQRPSLASVKATIGDLEVPVTYAGKQGGLVGVDQVNLQLARELVGKGLVYLELTVNGRTANRVLLRFS